KWDGWGTNLKPSHKPIILVRKPLHDGRKLTVIDCVERYGTGAIKIDTSRIASGDEEALSEGRFPAHCSTLESDQFYTKYFNISPKESSKKASKKDSHSDWQADETALGAKKNMSVNAPRTSEADTHPIPQRNNHAPVNHTDL